MTTTSDAHTLLSVRGEAQRMVAADQASIFVSVSATGDTQRAAAVDVAGALAGVTADLAELSGEVLTAQNTRASLTWSTQSIQTTQEYTHDKTTGVHRPTGRHQSLANVVIMVRDFTLLDRVAAVVTEREAVDVHAVSWSVDDDNSEWALVRAEAVRAALLKGEDYASALGGSVTGVEHVADAGLLGADASPRVEFRATAAGAPPGAESDVASLDPVPQVLRATIEARLTAVIGPLPTRRSDA